jgi:putative transcriptional regulator
LVFTIWFLKSGYRTWFYEQGAFMQAFNRTERRGTGWVKTVLLLLALVTPLFTPIPVIASHKPHSGLFLVATDHLTGTSFQETVILLTTVSDEGATGITINRPTDIQLKEVFPDVDLLNKFDDTLYLGGPINTHGVFVLINTTQPYEDMHPVTGNVYLSTAQQVFTHPLNGQIRTYAGYAGWAPGQLQYEIDRGDWLVVKTDPSIVFAKNVHGLWQQLKTRWSGDWI